MPVAVAAFSKTHWGAHIEAMRRGDPIAAEGKIVKVDHLAIYLDNCAIVEGREGDVSF